MPVLRSREIPPPQNSSSKTLKMGFIEPSTPSKSVELLAHQSHQDFTPNPNFSGLGSDSTPVSRSAPRRSLRLASRSNSDQEWRKNGVCDGSKNGGKNPLYLLTVETKNVNCFNSFMSVSVEENGDGVVMVERNEAIVGGSGKKSKRKSEWEEIEVKQEKGHLSLRSGTRVVKRMLEVNKEDLFVTETKEDVKEEKRKAVMIEGGGEGDTSDGISSLISKDMKLRSTRRFTREEKGKCKLTNRDFVPSNNSSDMLKLKLGFDDSSVNLNIPAEADKNIHEGSLVDNAAFDNAHVQENVVLQNGNKDPRSTSRTHEHRDKSIMDQFKEIARRNASKYAHFSVREEEEDHVNSEAEAEAPPETPSDNVEDWPGPFSTAMKIIKDREKNLYSQPQNLATQKGGTPLFSWTPRKERDPEWPKRTVPLLQHLCLTILTKNVDAITSLKYVPDVLRHRLTQMLCDSRKMNEHFLSLLLDGSPSELRLADCSWLEEDEFEKLCENCNTNNLTVLQLDLCGHCMSDSSLLKVLVPKGLPALAAISLKGGCRISDVGLSALVSSAPALRSINLSQCSLLTDVGINSIANSLGSIVQELYLDNCESLDAMSILPALTRLQCLEVLSLRGLSSVSDKFIFELVSSNGQNMKELVLANCVKLTDYSLKVIAEMCSALRVLDLSHLCKLTDIGMAYLANGCRGIQDLKLCRSTFSDEAIAAFLETSGESLKELSLNHIDKVSQNTTIALARRCKNLESLDLSWCRCLTDEALGFIADSCLSLKVLKLFGCTQVTRTFLDGHSNPHLKIIGMKLTPLLEHIKRPDFQQGPLLYSAVPSF